ncbi:MAG: group 1 truncated hemoglobin [Planctomycetota bacterium]|nr:group 1 truncated hemoglobin [Planctomycetota bacterium]
MAGDTTPTLYARLGGYDAIAAVADDLVSRLQADDLLGRFWQHRGADGLQREKQLLIDFLCANAGGNLLYTGRDMATTHRGMKIDETDWRRFIGHLRDTLASFEVGVGEQEDVLAFVESTKGDIVE